MPYDVITVGSATVDAFVRTAGEKLVDVKSKRADKIFRCYPLGSKILIKDLQFMTGGGGTNTSVSFSRLGLKTAYLGNLGNDTNGKKIIEELKKEKVDFIGTTDREQTNYSVILDSIGHDRTILVYREASENLDFKRIDRKKLRARCFYFSSMTGNSFRAAVKLMDYAQKNNIKVAFNPSTYQVKDGKNRLKPLLGKTDILIFNREEAGILLGMPQETKIEKLLENTRALGPKIAVITDGPKGAYCSDGIFVYSIIPRKVKIVETTGAGDAFASGFVAGLVKNKSIEFAMRLGLADAESVVQYYGAKNILLTWNAALREMKRYKIGVRKTKL